MKSEPEIPVPQANSDWRCHGWSDHARGRREIGDKMSFRERLEWLEEAMKFARLLAAAPVVPAPEWARRTGGDELAVAEEQATYRVEKPEANP